MTRNEAFKAMIDGHKVRHPSHAKGAYLKFNGVFEFYYFNTLKEDFTKSHSPELALKYEDGYEIYTEKKTEKVTWYEISYHSKGNKYAFRDHTLYKSKEDFLKLRELDESTLHWIKLEEVMTHEYLTE